MSTLGKKFVEPAKRLANRFDIQRIGIQALKKEPFNTILARRKSGYHKGTITKRLKNNKTA